MKFLDSPIDDRDDPSAADLAAFYCHPAIENSKMNDLKCFTAFCIAVSVFCGWSTISAQCPYEWSDEYFAGGITVDTFAPVNSSDTINDALSFDDGSGPALYVAGRFTVAGKERGAGVARWNGSAWQMLLVPGQTPFVTAMAVYQGSLYIGGEFIQLDGLAVNRIARWTGSGWVEVPGYNGGTHVRSMEVYDDGSGPKLYVGSGDEGLNDPNHLVRYDGSSWSVLRSTVGAVLTLEVADVGAGPKLYVGGQNLSTTAAPGTLNVIEYDGTNFSTVGSGLSGLIRKLHAAAVPGPTTSLFAIGNFTLPGSVVGQAELGRWDGTTWSTLPPRPSYATQLRAITAQEINGQTNLYLAYASTFPAAAPTRLISFDGQIWNAMLPGVDNTDSIVNVITALAGFDEGQGNRLFLFGSFNRAGTKAVVNAARWDGSNYSGFGGSAPNNAVNALQVSSDGTTLYAAGAFTSIGETIINRVAATTGSDWLPLGAGINGTVNALETVGSTLYAGGEFSNAGGNQAFSVASWSNGSWSALGGGVSHPNGIVAPVNALRAWTPPNGTPSLFVGGAFTLAGTLPVNRIAAWDGATWNALGAGVTGGAGNGVVRSMVVFDDGTGPALYVGGTFAMAGGQPATNIARWNGTNWSSVGTGLDNSVFALHVFDDGNGPSLVAGGAFAMAGTQPVSRLARWNGSSWQPLGSGVSSTGIPPSSVLTLSTFDDGHRRRLAIGGQFDQAGAVPSKRLVFWNGNTFEAASSFFDVATDLGFRDSVYSLVTFDRPSGPELFVGGVFATTTVARQQNLAVFRPDADSAACVSLDECANGNVGETVGGPFAVLKVNGRDGGLSHRVGSSINATITIEVDTPPTSPMPVGFTLFAYLDAPTPAETTVLPFDLGTMCFPPCLLDAPNPLAVTVADSMDLGAYICPPLTLGSTTPWALVQTGIPVPARVALQGLVIDPSRTVGVATTNAIVLVIGP